MDNYHSGIDRITSSGLKLLLKKTPAHYYAEYMGEGSQPTAAMEYGIAAHALILEGEEAFAKVAMAKPEGVDFRTKEGKAFKAASKGKMILSEKDIEEMYAFKDKLKESALGSAMFNGTGMAEEVVTWRDALTSADAKCKPDWMAKDGSLIIDLKMMADADPTNFKRAIYRYGYHISAAMYVEGVESHFNKKPRFVWAVCELSEGHDRVGHGLAIYAECKQRKQWPGYEQQVLEIG